MATLFASPSSAARIVANYTDPGAQCKDHAKCAEVGIIEGECCPKPNGKYLGCCANKPKKAKKAKKAPKAKKNSDPGPLYKCDTVPTYKLDVYLSCQRHKYKPNLPGEGKAGCFSLAPYIRWWCADKIQGPEFNDPDNGMARQCRARSDFEGNLFDGRCVLPSHKDYDQAVDFSGETAWNRPSRKGKWQQPPTKLPLEVPEEKPAGAIGWNPTSNRVAIGKWCEVGIPAKGWTVGSCPAQKTLEVKILSYNLYWWKLFGQRNGKGWMKTADGGGYEQSNSAGKLVNRNGPFDLFAFQECDDVKRILADSGISSEVESHSGRHAVSIAWQKASWKRLSAGYAEVSEDFGKPYWGYREVIFARLQHKASGKVVFFMNHHGPLPDRTPGGFCGAHATAYNLLRVAAERAFPGDVVILTGDFNAKTESAELAALSQHLNFAYGGESFHGVDNFLTNCADVGETSNYGPAGSDHDALSVVFKI